MSKTVLFRLPSGAGDFACADGEIESARNVRLRLYDGSVVDGLPDGSVVEEVDKPVREITDVSASEERGNNSNSISVISEVSPEVKMESPEVSVERPDGPLVRFALRQEVMTGWHNHLDNLPSRVVEAPAKPSEATWGEAAKGLFADYEREAAEKDLFTQPFFALSAVRLKSSARILPSVPVLMAPETVEIPFVEGNPDLELPSMSMTVHSGAYRLRVSVSGFSGLMRWDEVEALDIYVSQPIPRYYDKKEWVSLHRSSLAGDAVQAWRPEPLPDKEVTAALLSICSFRLVSTIRISDLPAVFGNGDATTEDAPEADGEVWVDVDFNVPRLTDLKEVEAYRPDYLQLQDISAAGEAVISGRRTLWDLTLTVPAVPPLAGLLGGSPEIGSDSLCPVAVDVEMMKQQMTLHSSRFDPSELIGALGEDRFPRWIFFPDPDVRCMTLVTLSGTFRVRMWPHPYLAGSFFWGGFGQKTLRETGVERFVATLSQTEGFNHRDEYSLPSAIWRSGHGSSLYFPDSLLMPTDDSRVIAVVRAFRASGLVATTAPTAYLFTTSGIYLLKEMDDGTLRDAGLMATYILRDAATIMVEGKTLRFTAEDGTVYVISGTTVKPAENSDGSGASGSGGSAGSVKTTVIIEPDGSGEEIYVLTRPIKRADTGVKLWSASLLGAFNRKGLSVTLQGSVDMVEWYPLAESDHSELQGLYTPGLRYCRLEIRGDLEGSLEGLELR